MDFLISSAYAQAAAAPDAPSALQPLILMAVFFAVFYFIALRPQMKRAKEQRSMLAALQKGDEVVAAGGILGRIENIGDSVITLSVADNISIKVQKGAIVTVLPKGTLKSV